MLSELLAARLGRDQETGLANQLYEGVRQAILEAGLKAGQRLPASRQLALDLGVGRNTVIQAYTQLADEGYVESRAGAGVYVAQTLPERLLHARRARKALAPRTALAAPEHVPDEVGARGRGALGRSLSRRGASVLDEVAIPEGGSFAPCVPELSLFPYPLWQRLVSKAWRQVRAADTRYAAPGGHPGLRAAIAEHVQLARQVRCTPEQVIIVNGAQHGLDLCARMLADAGERVWMEDPGYPGARRVFRAADLDVEPIAVDAEGLAPPPAAWRRAPRIVYITPSHQFPTGAVMSLRRRRELLDAAARHGSWIIEDDYDGEFRFAGRPIAALQGIDEAERVIYLGTFSKALFPGLRLGYLVLPPGIAADFSLAASQLGYEGRQVTQGALAEFIRAGHFAAHIRRMRVLYAARRDLLVAIWEKELGADAPLSGGDTGMHLIASLPPGLDLIACARAAEAGLVAPSLASLHLGPVLHSGLVLGYGAVDEHAIKRDAKRLARIVRAVLDEAALSASAPRRRRASRSRSDA